MGGRGGGPHPKKFFDVPFFGAILNYMRNFIDLPQKESTQNEGRKLSNKKKKIKIKIKIRGRKFSGLENGQVQTAVTFFLDGISGRGKIPLRALT